MADLTRNSCLQETYVPWFHQTGAIPVLLGTHTYWNVTFDLTDLKNISALTSLAFEGAKEYVMLLEHNLAVLQKPRAAMVGIAYLALWEEDYSFWQNHFTRHHWEHFCKVV
jgi:hypothetical protein